MTSDNKKSPQIVTNIFCVMGKPGVGRDSIIEYIFNRQDFIAKYNIEKFIQGTTRPIKYNDIDNKDYHFMTDYQFEHLDESDIIESRSYDNICDNKSYYYFTLIQYIKFGTNLIGKVAPQQYRDLRKWALSMELKNPLMSINIYPVVLMASVFIREKRLIQNAKTEDDVYNICAKMITERYEFKYIERENPEIMDGANQNTCVLDNNKDTLLNINIIGSILVDFMIHKIENKYPNNTKNNCKSLS